MQARCAGRRRWVGPGSRGGVARSGKGFRRALAPGRARVRWLHSELTTAVSESMSGAQRGKSRVCVQISVVKARPSLRRSALSSFGSQNDIKEGEKEGKKKEKRRKKEGKKKEKRARSARSALAP